LVFLPVVRTIRALSTVGKKTMASSKKRDFQCDVVNETVKICLRKKSTGGLTSSDHVLFVLCDQSECQYVDSNTLPCPLDLSLFEEEIREREETARLRREESGY
jgi:hypothetical protein